jgi:hypothetical protein
MMRSTLLAAVLMATSSCAAASGAGAPAAGAAPRSAEPRGSINQVEGRFIYQYYDGNEPDSHAQQLQAQGLQGGGPTWEGIIYGLLSVESPGVLSEIDFDAEGDGVAIWSNRRQPLDTIAALVGRSKTDRALLARAIEKARRDGRIE